MFSKYMIFVVYTASRSWFGTRVLYVAAGLVPSRPLIQLVIFVLTHEMRKKQEKISILVAKSRSAGKYL